MSAGSAQLVDLLLAYQLLYLLDALENLNAGPSIGVFSWFHEPSVPFLGLETVLELLVLFFLLFFLDYLVSPLVFFLELLELFIFYVGDVEGHGDELKGVGFLGFIVVL